jgi:hypothetical protein
MTDRDTIGTWLRGTAERDRSTPFGMAGKSDRVQDSRLKTRQRDKQSYFSSRTPRGVEEIWPKPSLIMIPAIMVAVASPKDDSECIKNRSG